MNKLSKIFIVTIIILLIIMCVMLFVCVKNNKTINQLEDTLVSLGKELYFYTDSVETAGLEVKKYNDGTFELGERIPLD